MKRNALIIGNSDGIGLGLTCELLKQGWDVIGISRSASSLKADSYSHYIENVLDDSFIQTLSKILNDITPDVCVYCIGMGELLDLNKMEDELDVFQVNLIGMIKTISRVVPLMALQGHGHFIGLSSVADVLLSAEAPAYHASKAAFSNYLEGLGLALKQKGVYVTNLRFGFVNTKMAKGDVKPFMISVEQAVRHILRCMVKKPRRYTAPKIVIPLVSFRRFMMRYLSKTKP